MEVFGKLRLSVISNPNGNSNDQRRENHDSMQLYYVRPYPANRLVSCEVRTRFRIPRVQPPILANDWDITCQ